MSEYVYNEPSVIKEGEKFQIICNKSKNTFSVGTGIVFHDDGEYLVVVSGNKITVEECRK